MFKRLFSQLDQLEKSRRPLLGPNIKALEFLGLLLPDRKLPKILYLTLHISIIIFTGTQFIDAWFNRNEFTQLLHNFKFLTLAVVNVVKVITFLMWQKRWRAVIEYVTTADLNQRTTKDKENKYIIEKQTKYCRIITYLFWLLTFLTASMTIIQPVFKYISSPQYRYNVKNGTDVYLQVINSWVPFDKNTVPGYLFASIIQSTAAILAGAWMISFDGTAAVIMVFFKGELKLLRRDCKNMFGTEQSPVSDHRAVARIRNYHERHIELLKNSKLFDSCLSPNMFLYMVVCSIMLCTTLYELSVESNRMQRVLIGEYLIFGIAQLFMYCWHSNDVLYASMDVMLGPYESLWCKRNLYLQKSVCLLILQFNKPVVFTAGPFSDLTVANFINILKGAYSYYTLLTQSQV